MRLIDVDELMIEILTRSLCGDDNVDKAIVEAPIVEAIPTAWIEKKITEYIISSRYGSDAVPIVYALLSDWRKENAGILQRD